LHKFIDVKNMTYEELYSNWYGRMKSFAREYVLSEDDAEDIVQDVFCELFPKYDERLHGINIVAYLYVAVKNRCIDHIRHRLTEEKSLNRMQDEFAHTLRMKFDSLEILDDGLFDETSVEDVVRRALDSLPERCREIFVKHKIDGMKHKDIAAELEISVKTVENQITIAYNKLREILQPYRSLLSFIL